jgi:hypothetical protein
MSEVKTYEVECHGGGEFKGAPALAIFEISQNDAKTIVSTAKHLLAVSALKMERFDYRVRWFENDPFELMTEEELARYKAGGLDLSEVDGVEEITSDLDCLVVYSDSFHYSCRRKHEDQKIESESQPIAALAAHFGLEWDYGYPARYLEAKLDGEEDTRFPVASFEKDRPGSSHMGAYYNWLVGQYEANGIEVGMPELAEMVAFGYAEKFRSVGVHHLDDAVAEAKAREAHNIKEGGLTSQVAYLLEAGGQDVIDGMLKGR